jgi:hypothetical protein
MVRKSKIPDRAMERRATMKRCGWLLVSLLVTLSLTVGLEVGVIGPLLGSEKPPIVQFSVRQIKLSPGEAERVAVSASPDLAVTSMRIFVSNQTVILASWLTPGREVEVSALAIGQSEVFILGPGYGISYVTLASLQVIVGE